MPSHVLLSIADSIPHVAKNPFMNYRIPPEHPYRGARCVFLKLYSEQRRLNVICLNTLLPFFSEFNARMKKLNVDLEEGKELPRNDAEDAIVDALEVEAKASVKVALQVWGENLSKLSIQSMYVSLLVRLRRMYANTIVYAWDVQQKLPIRYFGDVLQVIGLGRFRSWLGPNMGANDVRYFEIAPSSLLIVMEDSALRSHVVGAAEVIYEGLRSSYKRFVCKERSVNVPRNIIIALSEQCGIGMARSIGSGGAYLLARALNNSSLRGRTGAIRTGAAEFYGELVGGILFVLLISKHFPNHAPLDKNRRTHTNGKDKKRS